VAGAVWRRRGSGGSFYRRSGRGGYFFWAGGGGGGWEETASTGELAMMAGMALTPMRWLGHAGG
jgi:hypothetical protein